MSERVRVHVYRRFMKSTDEHPWIVTCALCEGFWRVAFRPWRVSATWELAIDYAQRHAVEHEKTRCQTCLHVPAEPLASERTNAS